MAELFDSIEINRAPRWPMLSRLLALSVVLHGLFLVAVVYVPTLRAILSVASTVSGLKLVSQDYDPTLLGQRATIMRLPPHEKLYYPPDYFGAPEVAETAPYEPALVQQAAPPPPVYYRPPRRAYTPRTLPTPQPTPTPELAKATPTPTPSAEDEKKKAEQAELDRIAKQNGVERPPEVNTKPFEDIARKGKELIDQGKLDLKNNTLDVTATAERDDDGTLKPDSVHINWNTTSDENTNALAQQLVMAFSQSKVLSTLRGVKGVQMALKLDQQNVSVKLASEFPSDDAASKYAITYALFVVAEREHKKGTQEGELFNNLKVSNDGKQLVLTFEMPKDAAGKMITDLLAKKDKEAKEKEAAAQNKS
jgi:hypothetical protein